MQPHSILNKSKNAFLQYQASPSITSYAICEPRLLCHALWSVCYASWLPGGDTSLGALLGVPAGVSGSSESVRSTAAAGLYVWVGMDP
jgi:hypothetical protein